MSDKTIAIITASSTSGRACLDTLLTSASPSKIRGFFRTPTKADAVREAHPSANIEFITGIDAADPGSLKPGLAGCTSALLVTPSDESAGIQNDAQMVANMINASVEARVKHIVFVGSWTVNAADRCPGLAGRFLSGENLLKEVGSKHDIKWTVLRGGYFQSNYALLSKAVKNGELRFVDFCAPANDPADIGRTAASVLLSPEEHHGNHYEISGPEKIWFRDVVKTIAEVCGKDIKFVPTGLVECTAAMPQFLKEAYEYIVERGEDSVPLSDDVLRVTGKPPESFREWAMENHTLFGA